MILQIRTAATITHWYFGLFLRIDGRISLYDFNSLRSCAAGTMQHTLYLL